jgi:hypothetical protein
MYPLSLPYVKNKTDASVMTLGTLTVAPAGARLNPDNKD